MAREPVQIDVPGWATLRLKHVLLDFTGTLSKSGKLIDGVATKLCILAEKMDITVATADTFGTAQQALSGVPVQICFIKTGADKACLAAGLGADSVVAIGNGRNDVAAVEVAGLGIAVIGPEGVAGDLVRVADIVVCDIHAALDMLLEPLRIVATLRQ